MNLNLSISYLLEFGYINLSPLVKIPSLIIETQSFTSTSYYSVLQGLKLFIKLASSQSCDSGLSWR